METKQRFGELRDWPCLTQQSPGATSMWLQNPTSSISKFPSGPHFSALLSRTLECDGHKTSSLLVKHSGCKSCVFTLGSLRAKVKSIYVPGPLWSLNKSWVIKVVIFYGTQLHSDPLWHSLSWHCTPQTRRTFLPKENLEARVSWIWPWPSVTTAAASAQLLLHICKISKAHFPCLPSFQRGWVLFCKENGLWSRSTWNQIPVPPVTTVSLGATNRALPSLLFPLENMTQIVSSSESYGEDYIK